MVKWLELLVSYYFMVLYVKVFIIGDLFIVFVICGEEWYSWKVIVGFFNFWKSRKVF